MPDSTPNNDLTPEDEHARVVITTRSLKYLLVVDDEAVNRKLLRAMLMADGYVVHDASNGEQALEFIAQERVDAVLLDLMMPGMTGFEVLKHLKSDSAHRGIPVIIVSSLRDRTDRMRALECGADEFLARPIDRLELRIRLRNLLRLKAAQESLASRNRKLHRLLEELQSEIQEHKETQIRLRDAARCLDASNEELKSFTSVISHDLKSPMRGVRNLASWLEEDLGGTIPDQSSAHLRQLGELVSRMESMCDGLLDYARAGKHRVAAERVETAELFHEVAQLACLPEGFSITVESAVPAVSTARAPLKEVLLNLAANAVKHHDQPSGKISLGCVDAGVFVRFTVGDDGPGIPPALQDRIFDLFYSNGPGQGTGMGLSYTQKMIRGVGGVVEVQSDGQRGTRFSFTWPKVWPALHGQSDQALFDNLKDRYLP